jgi:hypothetical protein
MDNFENAQLQPNDVAVIFRPHIEANKPWDGSYEVLINGHGPYTLSDEDREDLIGTAMLVASVVPFMEENQEFAEKLIEFCNQEYADMGEFTLNSEQVTDDFTLTEATRCVGRKQ